MSGATYRVEVRSSGHRVMGSSVEQHKPPVLAVLVGKKIARTQASGEEVTYERIRQESLEADIVVLIFERHGGKWRDIAVERLGLGPYRVNEILAQNFGYAISPCVNADEQRRFLKILGLAIDKQVVGG